MSIDAIKPTPDAATNLKVCQAVLAEAQAKLALIVHLVADAARPAYHRAVHAIAETEGCLSVFRFRQSGPPSNAANPWNNPHPSKPGVNVRENRGANRQRISARGRSVGRSSGKGNKAEL